MDEGGGGFIGLASLLSTSSVPRLLQARLMWPYSPHEKRLSRQKHTVISAQI